MVNHDEIMVIIVDYNGLTMVNNDENHGYLVGTPTPLKNHGVRQLGL